ncbi:YbaB/EbfC family nucleoid-associated protein [Candidatus Palauibacter soopunensis]|uniref:YbaB/EbfC family nucleoid-associated protein n=1 Tax=Candidatus Palauibacter soopunensis TaxID=3056739 RepID=UPI0023A33C2A|nr:YbaB/EbfC family nucleoid-associated protein [Candidatus Palauibacter soopunensis]MDE2878800.1 YbaB/EbfC family nucleoid-associated protein [Candidatus Palauibacter soopunensis]
MDGVDIQQLIQLSKQMQSRMSEMQEKLERETMTAASGGGMVEVTVDGQGNIKSVSIDPAVVDPAEVEMLEDLIVAAASAAQRRAKDRMESEMRQAAGGLPLPGIGNFLGRP